MVPELTAGDIRELKSCFPELIYNRRLGSVRGTLSIACSHEIGSGRIHFDDTRSNYLEESFEIRIELTSLDSFGCPKVFEDSSRILIWAKEEGISPQDLHVNMSDEFSCCLGIFPGFRWKSVSAFIYDYVIPFFYWQTYRRNKGAPPWDGHAHGAIGILNEMAMSPQRARKASSRNVRCPCGSGLKYKRCCLLKDTQLAHHL